MKIKLIERKFEFYTAWGIGDKIETSIKLELMIYDFLCFTFIASVPNKSCSSMNPLKALMVALESQTVGMLKYDRLKDRVREIKQWKRL